MFPGASPLLLFLPPPLSLSFARSRRPVISNRIFLLLSNVSSFTCLDCECAHVVVVSQQNGKRLLHDSQAERIETTCLVFVPEWYLLLLLNFEQRMETVVNEKSTESNSLAGGIRYDVLTVCGIPKQRIEDDDDDDLCVWNASRWIVERVFFQLDRMSRAHWLMRWLFTWTETSKKSGWKVWWEMHPFSRFTSYRLLHLHDGNEIRMSVWP